MAIYFKFNSWQASTFETVPVDLSTPLISVGEVKQGIIKKKKLDKTTNLILTDPKTGEDYKEDTQLLQKNTSVIVRIVPIFNPSNPNANLANQKPLTNTDTPTSGNKPQSNADELDEFGPALWETSSGGISQKPKISEEDKIMAVVNQASEIPTVSQGPQRTFYRPQTQKKVPPPGYVCYRCNQPGHFIYDCPTNGDPAYNIPRKPTTMHGVPKSFLEPSANGKTFEFRPNENDFKKEIKKSGLVRENLLEKVPKDLICPLCSGMLKNAVLVPCCTESACDDCMRSALLEKGDMKCPLCSESLSPDQLLPNKALRRAVDSLKLKIPALEEVEGKKETKTEESEEQDPSQPTETPAAPNSQQPIEPVKQVSSHPQTNFPSQQHAPSHQVYQQRATKPIPTYPDIQHVGQSIPSYTGEKEDFFPVEIDGNTENKIQVSDNGVHSQSYDDKHMIQPYYDKRRSRGRGYPRSYPPRRGYNDYQPYNMYPPFYPPQMFPGGYDPMYGYSVPMSDEPYYPPEPNRRRYEGDSYQEDEKHRRKRREPEEETPEDNKSREDHKRHKDDKERYSREREKRPDRVSSKHDHKSRRSHESSHSKH